MAVCQDFDHPDLQPRVLHVGTCYATQKGKSGRRWDQGWWSPEPEMGRAPQCHHVKPSKQRKAEGVRGTVAEMGQERLGIGQGSSATGGFEDAA